MMDLIDQCSPLTFVCIFKVFDGFICFQAIKIAFLGFIKTF